MLPSASLHTIIGAARLGVVDRLSGCSGSPSTLYWQILRWIRLLWFWHLRKIGTFGRFITSNTKKLRFESRHRQFYLLSTILKSDEKLAILKTDGYNDDSYPRHVNLMGHLYSLAHINMRLDICRPFTGLRVRISLLWLVSSTNPLVGWSIGQCAHITI